MPNDSTSIAVLAARRRPHDVRRANPAVDAGFAAVVTRCLEPDPRDRYPDACAVLADLERVQRGERPRAPFSFGRPWRHHGRAAARIAMLLAVVLLLAPWFAGFDADAVALRIQRAMSSGDEAAALERWRECDDDGRAQVAVALGRRLGADSALAAKVAKKLELALLTVSPCPNRRIALLPAREASPPPPVSVGSFAATDATCNLLVRPGRVWCFVMTTDQQYWWAPDDPWCLHLLLHLERCDGNVVAHSLASLPTGSTAMLSPGVRFEAGVHPVRGKMANSVNGVVGASFAVAPTELPRDALVVFRRRIIELERQQGEIDFWLRHPDEPPSEGEALWRAWRTREGMGTDTQPATANFWEAYRCAAWHGCRLPSFIEWQIAAHLPPLAPGQNRDRSVPVTPLAVDSPPEWDKTSREVCFANSNVREWILDKRRSDPVSFAAVPIAGPGGFLPIVPDSHGDAPSGVFGIRLYRSLLPVPGR